MEISWIAFVCLEKINKENNRVSLLMIIFNIFHSTVYLYSAV